MSPFTSVNAFFASIMPAPVESRSSFTIAAVIAVIFQTPEFLKWSGGE
jgi:hypothetical protein